MELDRGRQSGKQQGVQREQEARSAEALAQHNTARRQQLAMTNAQQLIDQ